MHPVHKSTAPLLERDSAAILYAAMNPGSSSASESRLLGAISLPAAPAGPNVPPQPPQQSQDISDEDLLALAFSQPACVPSAAAPSIGMDAFTDAPPPIKMHALHWRHQHQVYLKCHGIRPMLEKCKLSCCRRASGHRTQHGWDNSSMQGRCHRFTSCTCRLRCTCTAHV